MGTAIRLTRAARAVVNWRQRLTASTADVRMLVRTLGGDGPSPVLRSGRRVPAVLPTAPIDARSPTAVVALVESETAHGALVRIVPGGVDAALLGSQGGAAMRVTIAGTTHAVRVARGQSLLDAAERAGITMPFSCRAGGCGACRVRLVSGSVALPATHCLSAAELQAGDILACVCSPDTDVAVAVRP